MKKLLSVIILTILFISLISVNYAEIPLNTNSGYGVVIGGWLRMRSGPGYNYQTIASYENGTIVSILETPGDWAKVKAPDGMVGYMSRFYLNQSNGTSTNNPGNTGGYNAYVYSANGGPVLLRSGPSFSYGVLASYAYGTPLYVVNHGSQWDYIQIGSQYGYMKNQFIRTGDVPVHPINPPSGNLYTAYVYSSNGRGVRLRTSPNLNSPILGIYSVGTQVTVTQHNYVNGWDAVNIGSRTGYMMNKFLTTNSNPCPNPYPNPNIWTLNNVYLNTENAVFGDLLIVNSLSPTNATVDYRWTLNSAIIGTSSSCYVPDYAVGQVIKLTVIGTGAFSGTVTKYININPYIVPTPQPTIPVPLTSAYAVVSHSPANVGDTVFASVIGPFQDVQYKWFKNGTPIGSSNIYTPVAEDSGWPLVVTAYIKDKNGNSYTSDATVIIN